MTRPRFEPGYPEFSLSQWPRSLRRGSAAARLLGLRVRIPKGVLSLMNAVCCQVEASALGRSLILRISAECGVSDCDREKKALVH